MCRMNDDQSDPADLSSMTWSEVVEHAKRNAEGMGKGIFKPMPPAREEDCSSEEVFDEIRTRVADTARFHAEHPNAGLGAFGPANIVASWRDDTRPRAGVRGSLGGLGHLSGLFAHWFLVRPDRESFEEDLRAAQLALAGSPAEQELAEDLRDFVCGYVEGRISDGEFVRRLHKPRPKRRRYLPGRGSSARTRSGSLMPKGYCVGFSASTMTGCRTCEPERVWAAFKRFAGLSVQPSQPSASMHLRETC